MHKLILGIETSCDDSAVALYSLQEGLIGHRCLSQHLTHAQYGGVVPELASRDHAQVLAALLDALLDEVGYAREAINVIAYTAGPGLIGALLVGATFAQGLARGLGIPAIPVHHLQAHVMSAFLEASVPTYPFINLLVSGGHTQLIHCSAPGQFKVLGSTLDDAAGEAYDKIAKTMGLPYPGGPHLAQCAVGGNPHAFSLTIPKKDGSLEFSFSGLKTQAQKLWHELKDPTKSIQMDFAASVQHVITQSLLYKLKIACEQLGVQQVTLGGGVSANEDLRNQLTVCARQQNWQVYLQSKKWSTDNAAMVCICAAHMLKHAGDFPSHLFVQFPEVYPRWPIDQKSW